MDTAVLHDLLATTGPFASVYFDGSHDTEGAEKEIELRWRAARDLLVEADADEGVLGALDEAVRSGVPAVGRAGRFLIAAKDTVLVDEYLPEVPPTPMARVSALPYLVPLATQGPPRVPHLVVLVGKAGAELRAVDADGEIVREYTVDGQDHAGSDARGGWSLRKVQQHNEETVRHTIARVAAEVAQLGERAGARLIVLAGDVEPRTMLRRAIPSACAQIAVELESGSPGGLKDLEKEVAGLVTERWQAERGAVLERFRSELGRAGLAVQGLKQTTEALREANVATLVISDPAIGDRTVWTGTQQPQLVAVEPAELDTFGATERTEGRADEVLPAAAIAVGADLITADEQQIGDGVGALLRHNGGSR